MFYFLDTFQENVAPAVVDFVIWEYSGVLKIGTVVFNNGKNATTNVIIPFAVAVLGGKHAINLSGESFDIKIPAGIKSGEKLRVRGKGKRHGSQAGDLYLKIDISPNPEYEREGEWELDLVQPE